jgi:Na+/H+-dicarboxylate symporter
MADANGASTSQLQHQRFRVRAWVRTRLWAQVVFGLVTGIAVGVLLGPDVGLLSPEVARTVGAWLGLPGALFLGLIKMVLIPLVFASIIIGLNGAASGAELKAIGLRMAAFVLATTLAAALIGLMIAIWVQPGAFVDLPQARTVTGLSFQGGLATPAPQEPFTAAEAIAELLPTNPAQSILDQDMLAVVVMALLIGIAMTQVRAERAAPLMGLVEAVLSISMTIVKWAMFLVPWAVFGLMAKLVMDIGLSTILAMSVYVLTVLVGLLVLFALYLVIVALFGGRSPWQFARQVGPTLLLAFSTSSSSAVMPVSIDTAVKKLNVPGNIANLVVPLGATINMAGTALYQAIAILFLAQLSGIELSGAEMAMILVTLVASSIGAPGTPGVSIAILTTVAANYGIPAAGMVLVLGVDRILDMSRTVVNVAGDLTACTVLRKSAPQTKEHTISPSGGPPAAAPAT